MQIYSLKVFCSCFNFTNFLDLISHQIEVLDLEFVTLCYPQDFLQFLLRPAAKYLKKIALSNCGWPTYIDQKERAEGEVRDLLYNWKVFD